MDQNKKKTLIIAALGVVLVGVGAFQFMGASKPAQVPTKAKVEAKKDETEGQKKENQPDEKLLAMVAGPLPSRDPFEPQSDVVDVPPVAPDNAVVPPVAAGTAQPVAQSRPAPIKTQRVRPVAPVNPLPGGMGGPMDGMSLNNSAPIRAAGEFSYKVRGVVVGKKPMAVFEDDSGNQRLVPLGGSVDGDSKVVGIEKGRVKVRHKGKDQTLTLTEEQ